MKCALTGHRFGDLPFGRNEEDLRCLRFKDALRTTLLSLIEEQQVDTFLCGMALGCDQIAAELILTLKKTHPHIRLIAYVPCREQYLKWNRAQIARYRALLQNSDEIWQISDTYTPSCMIQRNRKMVEDADLLLALYTAPKRGGTFQTINFAKKKGIEIIVLSPHNF